MEQKNKFILSVFIRLALIISCLLVCVVLMLGVSLARYETVIGPADIVFQPEDAQTLEICCSGWEDAESGKQLAFTVKNTVTESKSTKFRLCLLTSAGLTEENRSVTLNVEGKSYTAVKSEIHEGSSLRNSFGEGFLYSFYSADGSQELLWEFNSSGSEENSESQQMLLLVSNNTGSVLEDYGELLRLIAFPA